MKKNNKTTPVMIAALTFALSAGLSGCSDDKKDNSVTFDHEHGPEVKDMVKHKFEHQFAKQCVEREIATSTNKNVDRVRWEKPCMCIADYMMKDLTAVEAEKFVNEKKHTQSMRIRFENAAYNCLQKNTDPEPPRLFGK